ncbi:hypothetical protein [Paraburkholderia sp. BCC1884]|uniref:hypothetical protein n=1 Tax=Paraburkholderia sp. BCC1884 TaxID=2562668 RepID=UPI001183DC56|nr:hypothetical protein [Paraburkholderia sp. BCC1884]
MDRRTFMMSGACLSRAAGGALTWPGLTHGAACHGTLALVDSTLPHGAAFAEYAAHRRWPTVEAGDDIGVLWYTKLAPLLLLEHAPATLAQTSLIGLTRTSDYFVLKRLATRHGELIEHSHEHGPGAAHVTFVFTPGAAVRT